MRLRKKLTFATALMGLLLLILSVSGAWYVIQLQRTNSRTLDVNVSSIRAAEEMELIVQEMRHEIDRFLLTQDEDHLVQALQMESDVQVWIDQAQGMSSSKNEAALLVEIQQGLELFFSRLRKIADSPGDSGVTNALESLEDDVLTTRILVAAQEYLDHNEQELQLSNQQSKTMAERTALALLLLGTSGAITGLVVGYGIARRISHSIFQLSVPIRDVAGKLTELVGPIEVSADPNLTELETILQQVSMKVEAVVDQLHARHREAIRADQLAAVGQLAAGLAHELRNPLMCMKTLVQAARRHGDSARVDSRDLTILNEEICRTEALLQTFLDFARPAELEAHDIDLLPIVRQTVELVSSKAKARNVTIDLELPVVPLVVHGDKIQLRQVLLNLLLNSLDAVQNGGEINVKAIHGRMAMVESDGQSQPCVDLHVADDGRGLPANDRSRIYEPFFSTKETGLGLGLAISQRIVDAHGGQLIARDREEGGTIFKIMLPSPAENES